MLRRFISSESGTTAVEYAVMLALIIVVMISAISLVGVGSGSFWNTNEEAIGGALNGNS